LAAVEVDDEVRAGSMVVAGNPRDPLGIRQHVLDRDGLEVITALFQIDLRGAAQGSRNPGQVDGVNLVRPLFPITSADREQQVVAGLVVRTGSMRPYYLNLMMSGRPFVRYL